MKDCSELADKSADSGIKSVPARFSSIFGSVTLESLFLALAAFCDFVA